ncbi:MAG TPA: proton-conducting transporter membrane subunit [Gemmatimonadales bacterium]|nr:proton-conducting transporter membrane subunit [Gemmatimonadales bacterium]
MMLSPGGLAGLAVAAPFVAATLILVAPKRLAEWWGYAAAAISAVAAAMVLPAVRAGEAVELRVIPLVPGLDLQLSVDALGITFGLLAAGLWIVTSVYTSGYVRANNLKSRPRFFAAFAASVGAALGVAFAGNLLTFFVFYELLTLATYPLVVHKETSYAYAAGRRYLVFSLGGGLALLTAVAWTWNLTGTLDFVPGGFLQGAAAPAVLSTLFLLFVVGVAVKAAVMPLHAWLPAAMVAPTPVSALLHAVAVVKAGVFGVMRVTGFVFGPESLRGFSGAGILAAMAMITIVAGSLIALRQDNLKRRLAYSTIVHLSYIVLGAALMAPLALAGSVMHMVNHGLAKITLFFCAGAIYAATGKENISDFSGLGRQMPWTFGAFAVASLALVGLPGLSGFVGKLFLARGAISVGDLLAASVMLGASLLTAAYLLPIVRIAFLPGGPQQASPSRREAPVAMVAPLVFTALLVVLFGFLPSILDGQFGLAMDVASWVFGVTP